MKRIIVLTFVVFAVLTVLTATAGIFGSNLKPDTTDYLANDAFSSSRIEEGKIAFKQLCASCHTESGSDMVVFGMNDFNPARVAGSVKKFAGPNSDPEIGEKVYEYLYSVNSGPFMSQRSPFLQPGPLSLEPGNNINPVLSNKDDFFAALTGHRIPAPEDVDLFKIYNSYDWEEVLVPFKMLSWSEFLPHSVPLYKAQSEVRNLLASSNTNTYNGLSPKFASTVSGKIYLDNQFSTHDHESPDFTGSAVESMYTASYMNWLSVLAVESNMPDYVDGSWNGNWAFGQYENPVLWKAGTALIHMNMYAIGPGEKNDARVDLRNKWTHYSLMFTSGIKNPLKPSGTPGSTTIPYSCKNGDMGKYAGPASQILLGMKNLAEVYYHSQMYPGSWYPGTSKLIHYGYSARYSVLQVYTPYTGFQNMKKEKEAAVNPLLETIYRQWKASICASASDLRYFKTTDPSETLEKENSRYRALVGTYDNLKTVLNEDQKNFLKCYIRRLYPMSPDLLGLAVQPYKWELVTSVPKEPVILPFGSLEALAGSPYKLRIIRTQAADGDVAVTAELLPPGAKLVAYKGNWTFNDIDYAIEWTPSKSMAGKEYSVKLRGTGAEGNDCAEFTIKVNKSYNAPVLDKVTDKIVYVGQQLTFPITTLAGSYDNLSYDLKGDFGKVIENAQQTGAIFTVVPRPEDIGSHLINLTAVDQDGRASTISFNVNVKPNAIPIVKVLPLGAGPGSNKNIYYAKAGETLTIEIIASDPDGDALEISKNADIPGIIKGNKYIYTVEEDVARNFPGPNVLTFAIKDMQPVSSGTPTVYKGGETYKTLLIYFETSETPKNHNPWAVTGPVQTVKSGATVRLNGTLSDDSDNDPITYQWKQTEGPLVTISGSNTSEPSFTAPKVSIATTLEFILTVKDPYELFDTNVSRVKVLP